MARPLPSAVLPLLLLYVALVVYASLYPFTGWHDQGIAPWSYLRAPWPRYWTRFDLFSNLAGYAPLGFLLTLAFARVRPAWLSAALATLVALVLSFCMESLQSYLPLRVASNVDLALNTGGALLGAACAAWLQARGHLERWQRLHTRWFIHPSRGALVLLAFWPVGLLSPESVAYGMGRIFEQVEDGLAAWLQGTPFLDLLPLREFELQPMLPTAETLCVAIGALAPCLLGCAIVSGARRRAVFAALMLACGVAALALGAALAWGPPNAWAWMTAPVLRGILLAVVLGLALAWLPLPAGAFAAMLLAALAAQLMLLNGAAQNVYFTSSLQGWEPGQFVHFFGLTQWIAWLWPYATLIYLFARLLERRNGTAPRIDP